MPDYNISLQFYGLTIGNGLSAFALARALEGLGASDRLDYNYLKNIPGIGGGDVTAEAVILLFQGYSGDEKIPNALVEAAVASNLLKYRGTYNPYDFVFASEYTCLPWEFFIATNVPVAFQDIVNDGDWLIALQAVPPSNLAYSDPDKWYILKMSNLADSVPPVFQANVSGGGVVRIGTNCSAGMDAFAINHSTTASGDNSFAHGYKSLASRRAERAFSTGLLGTNAGDTQFRETLMHLQTTNAVQTQVVSPQRYYLQANVKSYMFDIRAVARVVGGLTVASWNQRVVVSCASDGTTLISKGQVEMVGIPAGRGSTLSFSVSAVSNELLIYCTGIAATSINWNILIESLEVATIES